jgi:hypothetical protein
MYLLAFCKKCKAPQGMFTNIDDLKNEIREQKICWFCDNDFIFASSKNLINLSQDEFQDSETLIKYSLNFWNDDWENKYVKWLDKKNFEISAKTENHYISVRDKIEDKFKQSTLWIEITQKIKEFHIDYKTKNNNYNLFMRLDPPVLKKKSYESFFLKTFRKNILQNKNQFESPSGGWILPNNWFSKINDIVRTCFVVKYLDGVEYLTNEIESICDELDISYMTSFEAKEEGYYAAHMLILQEFDVPDINWDSIKIKVWIELQITTQLQEVIRNLLHDYYEENRKKLVKDDVKWQWDYRSNEFATNYLGHILHYVEGMIMEIRDK